MKILRLTYVLALAASLFVPAITIAETEIVYSNADAFIRSDNTTTSTGGDFRMLVGELAGSGANDLRAVLSFDLSSLPVNATINSVSLVLRVQDNDANSGTATITFNLHALTQSWSEGSVSWANAATGVAWSTPGGVFDSTVLSSASVPTKGTTPANYTWASSAAFVTAVQTAYNSGSMVGLLLKDSDETGILREIVRFISKDETGSTLQVYRPHLLIDYSVSTIPEPSSAAALFGVGVFAVVACGRRTRR